MTRKTRLGIIAYQVVFLITQLVISVVSGNAILSLGTLTAIFGALYVSKLSFKHKSAFAWALLFNVGMLIMGVMSGIFSEMIQQPMFFIVNLTGVFEVYGSNKLVKLSNFFKKLGQAKPVVVLGASVVLMVIWGFISYALGSTVPIHDGILGGLALSAQLFSIAEHKYSWWAWITLNVVNISAWLSVGNAPVAIMYLTFIINALIGLWFWSTRKTTTFNNK